MKRLIQFRLRTLLAAMLVIGCGCGYLSHHSIEFRNEKRLTDEMLNMVDGDSVSSFYKTPAGDVVYTKQLSGFF